MIGVHRTVQLCTLLACLTAASRLRAQPDGKPDTSKPDGSKPDARKVDPAADTPPVQAIAPDDTAPVKTPPAATTPTAPAHTMDELTIPKSFLRFGINFFGDTTAFAKFPDSPHTGFAVGLVDLRLLADLGAGIDALSEIGLESRAA